ncbi:MAG: site-2 protease family protein [Pseudomonadota bacterium]
MDLGQILRAISVIVLPWLLAVTVPSIVRARVAVALGDPTPAVRGKVSLNPLDYADPLGTVVLPVLMIVSKLPFLFGWSKPSRIDPRNFAHPRVDLAIVSAAVPIAGLLMAWLWGLLGGSLAVRGYLGHGVLAYWVVEMAKAGLQINAFFAAINLLPVPPLAGGRILMGVLPLPAARVLARIEPYGQWVVIGILLLEGAGIIAVLTPFVVWIQGTVLALIP